jgi:hypothetical protein
VEAALAEPKCFPLQKKRTASPHPKTALTEALKVLKTNHPSTCAVPHHQLQFGYLKRWTEQGLDDGRKRNCAIMAVGRGGEISCPRVWWR